MKLLALQPAGYDQNEVKTAPTAWQPWYDKVFCVVVAAKTDAGGADRNELDASRQRSRLSPMRWASFVVCAVMACGAGQREKTIAATYQATTIAAAHLVTYEHDREVAIIGHATSEAEGKAQLAAERAKVNHAEKVIAGVYRAIAAAAVLNDDQSLAALVQAALVLSAELHDLGVP